MDSSSGMLLLIVGALIAMVVLIAVAAAGVLLVLLVKRNKIRSYRVDLQHYNNQSSKEMLIQGKTPAEALQAAQQAGLIPSGYQVVSLREVGKDGQDLLHDAATAAVITGINNVANQNIPHLW